MILLTGGTGFLGTRVLAGLLENKYPVRVLTRGATDWRGTSMLDLKRIGADVYLADLRNPVRVRGGLEGCNVVINLAGIMRQSEEGGFEDVHVEGVKILVEEAERAGVQRFIHVSCLGPEGMCDSQYYESKRRGEEIVRQGKFFWTIFRPSFMFGEQCKLLEILVPLIRKSPVLPILGGGLNEIQPVHVDVVRDCVLQCIYNRDTANQTYDLAGPRAYSLAELMQLVMQATGKTKPPLSVPTGAAVKGVTVTGFLMPKLTITADAIKMVVLDSVADTSPMTKVFAVENCDLTPELPRLVDMY